MYDSATELIRLAQRFGNGADIHRTRELIQMRQGVINGHTPKEREAFAHFDSALRKHVAMLQKKYADHLRRT